MTTPLDPPKIKWACAKEAPRRSPRYSKGQELEDPSNGTKIKIGSTLTKEYLLARIKARPARKDEQPSLVS